MKTNWMRIRWWAMALFALCASCAGFERGCASCNAESFGSDWIVVQLSMNGQIIRCWRLDDVSITNEHQSDGIYWRESGSGHLVHISGWYNRVQVSGRNFESAAKTLGVDLTMCTGGTYTTTSLDEMKDPRDHK